MGPRARACYRRSVERLFVALVALHSLAVGVALTFFPRWSLALGGFDPAAPVFFVRQGGAFHLVLAVAYLAQHLSTGRLTLVILAKSVGTAFLAAMLLGGGMPWAVTASSAGDALMAVLALGFHLRGRRRSPPAA